METSTTMQILELVYEHWFLTFIFLYTIRGQAPLFKLKVPRFGREKSVS